MSNTKNFGGSSNMRTQVQNLWQAINNLSSQIDPSNNPVDPSNNQIPPGVDTGDYLIWDSTTSSYKSIGQNIKLGSLAGTNQSNFCIGIGLQSGQGQDTCCTSIGPLAGTNQLNNSISIGFQSGQEQKSNCVSIGTNAGQGLNYNSVAIGSGSGYNAGEWSVSMGYYAGRNPVGEGTISIGTGANQYTAGLGASSIGFASGQNSAGAYSTNIGYQSNNTNAPVGSSALGYASQCTLPYEVFLGHPSNTTQVKSHGYFVSDQGFKLSSGGSNTQYFTTDGGVGAPSSSGSSNIYLYNSSTNTDLLNINSGQIRYNQAIQPNANQICISHLTRDNVDIDPFLELVAINNIIYIQDQSTSINYIKYKVIAPPSVSPNNYYIFTVSHLDSGGTGASNFPNGHNIFMSIYTDTATIDSRLNTLDSEVLALQNGKLSLTGGFMTGNIDMQNNGIDHISYLSFNGTTNCGFNNTNNYDYPQNVMIGEGNTNNDTDQILVGVGNSSSSASNVTLAIGYVNVAESNYGLCLGQNNIHGDTQKGQICIGSNNTTSGEGAMALGSNITNGTKNSLCIGTSNMAWIFPNSSSCALGNPNTYPFKEIYIDGGIIKTGGTSTDLYCGDGTIDTTTIFNAASALALVNQKVSKSGDTMTGNLDMNTYNLSNVNTLTVNQITPTSSNASDIGTSALPFRDFYINKSIKQSNHAFLDFQNYDTNYVGMLFVQGSGTIATRSTSNWTPLGSSVSNAPVYNLSNVFNRQPCCALFTSVAVSDGAPCGFVSTATTGISLNTGFSWGLQAFLGIADTAYNSNNCQNFFGLWNTNTAIGLTQAIQLSTRTNFIAFGSNTTDTNLCIYTAGASSTVKQVDLGVNFPANRPSGSASTDFFRLSMYYNQSTGVVYYKVANLNTGYNVVGTFTPAAGSMPLSSVALYPQINRTMGNPQTTGQAKLQVQRFGVLTF